MPYDITKGLFSSLVVLCLTQEGNTAVFLHNNTEPFNDILDPRQPRKKKNQHHLPAAELKAEREALFVDAEVELLKHQLFSSHLDATSEETAKKHQTTGGVI